MGDNEEIVGDGGMDSRGLSPWQANVTGGQMNIYFYVYDPSCKFKPSRALMLFVVPSYLVRRGGCASSAFIIKSYRVAAREACGDMGLG